MTFTVSAFDVDVEENGQVIGYSASSNNPGLVNAYCENYGTICSLDVQEDQNGEAVITVCASDYNGGDDCQSLSLIVNPINDDMVVLPVGDLETDEDEDLTFEICVEDVDVVTNAQVIDFNVECSQDSNDSDDLFSLTCDSSDCADGGYVCTFDVANDQNGNADCSVFITDGNGSTYSEEFSLTVNPVNDAPILSAVGSHSTDEDEDLTISVSASDVDIAENGQSMTFTLECTGDDALVSTSCVSTGDNTADCTFDVQDDQNGSVDCVVTVDDNSGATDSESFGFTVNPVNDAPILSAVGNQETDEDEDLTISVSASDVDIETNDQSMTFTLECGDDSLVTTDCISTGSATADCTFDVQDDQNGSVDCIITVNDGYGRVSDSEDVTLTVNGNSLTDSSSNFGTTSSSHLTIGSYSLNWTYINSGLTTVRQFYIYGVGDTGVASYYLWDARILGALYFFVPSYHLTES